MFGKKHSNVIGTIITIIILILLVILTNIDIKNLSYAESLTSSIIRPVQNGFAMLKNKVTGNKQFFTDLDTLRKENEELT